MTARDKKETQYSLFAWQGIQIATPADWEPSRLTGGRNKGNLSMEDEEGHRLEMRWIPSSKDWKPGDAIDSYVKILKREAGENEDSLRVRRGIKPTMEFMDSAEQFIISGGEREAGISAGCGKCSRATILRISLRKDDRVSQIMKRIFLSLRDHTDDGWIPWSLFGFRFDLHETYQMRQSDLSVGYMHLSFSRPGRIADAVRMRPASLLLKNSSLIECVKKHLKRMKMKDLPVEERTVDGRVEIGLRKEKRWKFFSSAVHRLRAWESTDADAIYLARWSGPEKEAGDFDRFAGSFGDSRI